MYLSIKHFNDFISFAERTCVKLTGLVNAFSDRKVTDMGMMFVDINTAAYTIMCKHFGTSLYSHSIEGRGEVYIANKCEKARFLCYWDVSDLSMTAVRIFTEYFGDDFEVIFADNQFGENRAYFVGVLFSN